MTRSRRSLRLALLLLAAVLLADQAVQWTVLRDGWFLGRRIAPFDPPLFNERQEAARERLAALVRGEAVAPRSVRFDAELGWAPEPGSSVGDFSFDEWGARIGAAGPLPRERSPGVRRVVALGCSFTHGDEVVAADTWCSRLDTARADLEVANLGVGGYGADQMLLRLRRDGLPLRPDEVLFALLPAAALRVTDLYRPALRHHDPSVGFKPRFVPEGALGLRLVPCPARDVADALRLLTDQAAFAQALREDFWVARCPEAWAPLGSCAAHRSALARLLLTRAEGGERDVAEWLARADAEPRRVLEAVVLAARDESVAAGARFRLLLLPDREGLIDRQAHGAAWGPLAAALAARGCEVLDLSAALLAAGALSDEALWQPGGHYGPALHAAVAAALSARLAEP
jgi:hypothetical protein